MCEAHTRRLALSISNLNAPSLPPLWVLFATSKSEDPKRPFRGQVLGFRGQAEVKSRSHIGRGAVDPRYQRGQTDEYVSFVTPFSSVRHTVFRTPSQKPGCFRGKTTK